MSAEWVEKEDRAGRYLAGRARVPSRPFASLRDPTQPRRPSFALERRCSAAPSSLTPDSTTHPLAPRRPSRCHPPTALTLLSDTHLWAPTPFVSPFSLSHQLPSPLFVSPDRPLFLFFPIRPTLRPFSSIAAACRFSVPLSLSLGLPIALVSSGHAASAVAATHGSSRCPDSPPLSPDLPLGLRFDRPFASLAVTFSSFVSVWP